MNVYTVIYEQQRDKVHDDMQEALRKAQDTDEEARERYLTRQIDATELAKLKIAFVVRSHSWLVHDLNKKPPLFSRGSA